jgi:WD40 repeat protein
MEAPGNAGFRSVVFSPDGKTLAGLRQDNDVYVWDRDTGRQQASYPPLVGCLFYNARGRLVGFDVERKVMWDVSGGRRTPYPFAAKSGEFEPCDHFVLFRADQERIKLWDLVADKETIFQCPENWWGPQFVPAPSGLALGIHEKDNLWVVRPGQPPLRIATQLPWTALIALAPAGDTLAMYDLVREEPQRRWFIQIVDWLTGRETDPVSYRFVLLDAVTSRSVASFDHCYWGKWSPDGKTLAVVSSQGKLYLYDWPLRRQWATIVLWSMAAVGGTVLFGKLVGSLRRKRAAKATTNQTLLPS